MSEVVLDASVVLAAVLQEAGGEVVGDLAGPVLLSAVNYAEVRSRLSDLGVSDALAAETIDTLGLDIVAFDLAQARHAGELRRATREAGLSLGDRACLALAASRKAPAMTADRAWQRAALPIDIQFVR